MFRQLGMPLRPLFRMNGIVGIEVEITRIEGKFKLSQNRPADAPGVIAPLAASVDQQDRELAAMMNEAV